MNPLNLLKLDLDGGRIHGGNQLSEKGHYAEPRMESIKKTRLRVGADLRPQIAEGLRAARTALGLTQTGLAELLGSSQGAITRWERQVDSPPVSVFHLLAELVPEEQRALWLDLSGGNLSEQDAVIASMRSIPLLRDAAAAGAPRVIDENEVEDMLYFPRNMLSPRGKLVAIHVAGDSMSPILESGYIVIIDVANRHPSKLVNRMVAARDGEGITIKWLRKQEPDLYMLVPQNTSPRHQIIVLSNDGGWSIVGEVVKWIGEPPGSKRK